MATARSTPAAGSAAAQTLAGKPAAKVATPFRRVGCVHSVRAVRRAIAQPALSRGLKRSTAWSFPKG
ncbi:hypothetical protein AB6866_23365 [Rahnella inusitata]|uniref:hypothetical protein n=1 Tax=Rahnella TaxID=34037 RepID=UPI0039B12540